MNQGSVKVYNEVTKKEIVAYVLRQDDNVLRVAINGTPVTMTRIAIDEYEGRIAGMVLTTKKPL